MWNGSVFKYNQLRSGWGMLFRDGRKWFFFQFQPISEMTDRNGNITQIVRQNNAVAGSVARIISPNGRTVDFTYNTAGLVSALTDNIGRKWTYNYDSVGRLVEVVDLRGGTRDYTWDTTNNRVTSIHDPNGNVMVQNEYDISGRVTRQVLADGNAFRYDYTSQNSAVTRSPRQHQTCAV